MSFIHRTAQLSHLPKRQHIRRVNTRKQGESSLCYIQHQMPPTHSNLHNSFRDPHSLPLAPFLLLFTFSCLIFAARYVHLVTLFGNLKTRHMFRRRATTLLPSAFSDGEKGLYVCNIRYFKRTRKQHQSTLYFRCAARVVAWGPDVDGLERISIRLVHNVNLFGVTFVWKRHVLYTVYFSTYLHI